MLAKKKQCIFAMSHGIPAASGFIFSMIDGNASNEQECSFSMIDGNASKKVTEETERRNHEKDSSNNSSRSRSRVSGSSSSMQ